MRRHALLGVLAAISCARPTTAWDETCWDCSTFRASLWLPFSKGDTRSRQWAVAAKIAAEQFNARNGSIVAEFAKLPLTCKTMLSVDVWDTWADGPLISLGRDAGYVHQRAGREVSHGRREARGGPPRRRRARAAPRYVA